MNGRAGADPSAGTPRVSQVLGQGYLQVPGGVAGRLIRFWSGLFDRGGRASETSLGAVEAKVAGDAAASRQRLDRPCPGCGPAESRPHRGVMRAVIQTGPGYFPLYVPSLCAYCIRNPIARHRVFPPTRGELCAVDRGADPKTRGTSVTKERELSAIAGLRNRSVEPRMADSARRQRNGPSAMFSSCKDVGLTPFLLRLSQSRE